MNNRDIVQRQVLLDAAFKRVQSIAYDPRVDFEHLADHAKYLCVLVAGFLEGGVRDILIGYCHRTTNPRVARYAAERLDDLTNMKTDRLLSVLQDFDPKFSVWLRDAITLEQQDAINSIVSHRHLISHGRSSSVTLVKVKSCYKHITSVLEIIDSEFR